MDTRVADRDSEQYQRSWWITRGYHRPTSSQGGPGWLYVVAGMGFTPHHQPGASTASCPYDVNRTSDHAATHRTYWWCIRRSVANRQFHRWRRQNGEIELRVRGVSGLSHLARGAMRESITHVPKSTPPALLEIAGGTGLFARRPLHIRPEVEGYRAAMPSVLRSAGPGWVPEFEAESWADSWRPRVPRQIVSS